MDFEPMSPEEMQRTMQFVLRQQAQFAADLAKFEVEWNDRINQVTGGLLGLTRVAGQLASAQLRTDEQLRELRDSDARLQQHIESVESHLHILIERSSGTCARTAAGRPHDLPQRVHRHDHVMQDGCFVESGHQLSGVL